MNNPKDDLLESTLSCWEEFYNDSTDLVPTLLNMFNAISLSDNSIKPPPIPPSSPIVEKSITTRKIARPTVPPPPAPKPSRPLSSTSTSSSSSLETTAGTSHAYLASTESLDDQSSDEEEQNLRVSARGRLISPLSLLHRQSGGSNGSADSGVGGCSNISAPCPPPIKPKYCDPNLSFMDKVILEIVETETFYVKDLESVIMGYLDVWRTTSDCAIETQQLKDLFNNMEDILKFNSEFLGALEKCGLNPVNVAKCFVSHKEGFCIYTEYCTGYPRTVSVLTELMRNEDTVKLCRDRQTALQQPLPLGSYLLKPVQRILKYHLLLQNMVKQFESEDKEEKEIVEEALNSMTNLAQHINEMKRKHEHAVRVQEIQSLLLDWQGDDLTTLGELCAEGLFRMCGAKALRHLFLFDKMLLIAKRSADALSCKTHIECSNLMLIESIPGEPLSFHVIPFDNPRQQYTFQARSLEQKREWSLQLKKVILENYTAVIPNHARQLVMQLGQGRSEDELLAERSTPRRQHNAPQYLQKRQQERRKSETGLIPNRLRKSRRSDAYLTHNEGSPTLPRRKQRSVSANRENSEKSLTLNTSADKIKDRFYNHWHRKSSEPYTSLTLPSKLSQLFSSDRRSTIAAIKQEIDLDEDGDDDANNTEVELSSAVSTTDVTTEEATTEKPEENEAASIEQIVGELVLQNINLRRSRSMGKPSDSSSDCDQPSSPRQKLRTQRLARMNALRQQQEKLNRHHSFLHKWQEQQKQLQTPTSLDESQQSEIQQLLVDLQQLPKQPELFIDEEMSIPSPAKSESKLKLNKQINDQPLPVMYKQGSSSLGARLAQSCNSEYADPNTLLTKRNDDFYEETLSAVLDQEEAFRDSAIFSDEENTPTKTKIPPPVPQKPKFGVWNTMKKPQYAIKHPDRTCTAKAYGSADDLLDHDQDNNSKQLNKSYSVQEIQEEEEEEKPRGWVKQMVGRLQATN